MEHIKSVIYNKDVMEFVTVGVQYCAFLEQSPQMKRQDFMETLLKLLPLLYLKAVLLPKVDDADGLYPEEFVTEQDYEAVRRQIAAMLGEKDAYLDLDLANLHYIQEPQMKNISEDLADIYQAVRNFVTPYKLQIEDSMYEALAVVCEQFELYWGQTLLSGMRALHNAAFDGGNADGADEADAGREDEMWE